MSDDTLFRAVGEIDDKLLLETEAFLNQSKPKRSAARWVRWGAAAACLLLVVSAVVYGQLGRGAPNTAAVPSTEMTDPPAVSTVPSTLADPVTPAEMHTNELAELPNGTSNFIALHWEDFVSMTYGEVLDYFGVALPVEEALPGLTLNEELSGCYGYGFGVYWRADEESYFDNNGFVFTDKGGMRRFTVGLGTTFISSLDINFMRSDKAAQPLEFTRLKGWDLILFHYTDKEGKLHYRTEFFQNGVAYWVSTTGLTEEEFARGLMAILEEKPAVKEPATILGTVSWVDGSYETFFDGEQYHYSEYHDYIEVLLDEGQQYKRLTIWLPNEAKQYTKGDRVAVTFTGEPATIGIVWPGQLIEVTPVE